MDEGTVGRRAALEPQLAASAGPCLIAIGSPRASFIGKVFRLRGDESVIGREPEADVVIEHPGVSRRHAKVVRQPGGAWMIVDLGSRNGTYVNGVRIHSAVLREGDRIQIGGDTALRYSLRDHLGETEERLRQALSAAGVGTWEWDVATRTVALSVEAERMLRLAAGIPAGDFWQLVDGADRAAVQEALAAAPSGRAPCELEFRLARGHGSPRWIAMRGELVTDEAGSPLRIAGTLMDVTARKQSEAELRRQALMFESLNDGVVVLDLEGAILDWNAAAEQMFGFAKAEVLGKLPADVFRAEDATLVMAAGIAREGRWSGEVTVRRNDGSECVAEATALPLRDAGGQHLANIVLYRDLTDRRQLQARLLLADRMASLGTLAAGMAHEINNPLAFVLGNLVYLADALPPAAGRGDPKRLEDVQLAIRDAREGAERIRAIVRDLVTFARGREPERAAAVDLGSVLEFAIKMAHNEIRHRAALVKHLAIVPPIAGGESRLGQVFLNLLVNAAQAIPEGAATRNEIRVTTRHDPSSGRVVAEVADTGVGIPPEDLGRIFDPFFTTKRAGGGTGLGLSICHSIVTSLGGDIAIESQVGHGTTVRVFLPVAGGDEGAPRESVVPLERGRARILVIDDEPLVGDVIARLLSPHHDVRPATKAADAYDLIAAGARFDVILCDLIMPEMTGMDLYGKLLAAYPEQAKRVVFMTGGAFTDGARLFLEKRRSYRVVTKPIDLAELTAIVSEMLAARIG